MNQRFENILALFQQNVTIPKHVKWDGGMGLFVSLLYPDSSWMQDAMRIQAQWEGFLLAFHVIGAPVARTRLQPGSEEPVCERLPGMVLPLSAPLYLIPGEALES